MKRLLSLDFMRGLIMVLLMLEATDGYERLAEAAKGTVFVPLVAQLFHHPWNGLRCWDLIQPGFMFVAGTAMAYSLHQQQAKGVPWRQLFLKVLKRSGLLLFWGIFIRMVHPDGLSFELWNVLAQLAFTTLLAFLIFFWSVRQQILFSLGLLVLTELLYRCIRVPGFDQPFTDQHNVGNYIDMLLMHKTSKGGWVAINCLPTACHTIWGALAGKLLLSQKTGAEKLKWLGLAGLVVLVAGYGLGWTVTPIIKRIATSSFVLVSGGWCLLGFALCYWWIDIRGHQKFVWFFSVVGVNSLFIYLLMNTVAGGINEYADKIAAGYLSLIHVPSMTTRLIASLLTFLMEWYICWFLFKKKIFIKI
ncbi:MAG: DUF5009 domain-containing protein [Chitinophagaceae bacterium]|nr:DUF5009 domain-containing protein [Chitinophagaceae bacterium]